MSDPPSAGGEGAEAAVDSMRRAVELNDGIVQLLAVARYALDAGDSRRAREAIDDSLQRARDLMSALLASSGVQMRPGDLRRGSDEAKAATRREGQERGRAME